MKTFGFGEKGKGFSGALRPADWMHFLLFPLAGWIFDASPRPWDLLLGEASCALLLAHAYAFNNYRDNGARQSRWWHRCPLLIFLALLPLQGRPAQASGAAFLMISFIYSGRFRLKRLPLLGVFLNGLGFALFTLTALSSPSGDNALLFLMTMLWVSSTQLVHEEAHARQDSESGYLTTALLLGAARARAAAALLLLLASFAAYLLRPMLGLTLLAYALVFSFLALRSKAGELRASMKWTGLLWAANAGLQLLPRITDIFTKR